MKNKCTLIIDGNWLLQSRMAPMIDQFNISLDENLRKRAYEDLSSRLAYSIVHILNRFKSIDNIILVSDGGSWRKKLAKPASLEDIKYKGNRVQSEERDWNYIYKALNDLEVRCKALGITTSRFFDVEGDDWCWYWSRRLNSEGIHCIVWSIDNDLKQLVQVDNGAFTVWYNDRNGLFIHNSLEKKNVDDIEFFLTAETDSPILDELKRYAPKVVYFDPNTVIMDKVICGDSSDNIKSIIRYTKNGRNRRVGEKECDVLLKKLNINSIQDLVENRNTVIDVLDHKYADLKLNKEDLYDCFDYNKKLVWLDESTIPASVQTSMCKSEYKLFDLSYIRNNVSVLLSENNEISDLFEGI